MRSLIRQGDVLAYEHTDANTRHIEAVKEGLDVGIDLHTLPIALVLEYALGHSCDDAVMPPFYAFQRPGKALVVVVELRGPVPAIVCCSIVPP